MPSLAPAFALEEDEGIPNGEFDHTLPPFALFRPELDEEEPQGALLGVAFFAGLPFAPAMDQAPLGEPKPPCFLPFGIEDEPFPDIEKAPLGEANPPWFLPFESVDDEEDPQGDVALGDVFGLDAGTENEPFGPVFVGPFPPAEPGIPILGPAARGLEAGMGKALFS